MYILQRDQCTTLSYLKYDGWAVFPRKGPLDLSNCILFTKGEAKLNPPQANETYQHWGCYTPIRRER